MTPVIAIVGRPNVGKSTLFNRLIGKRQALVDDRPGVTRDRHYGTTEFEGREFVLVDTGGFEPDLALLEAGDMFRTVRLQAEAAVEEADVILFVVDRIAGLTPADRLTADILRKRLGDADSESRLLLVINKCDGAGHDVEASEFWELGFPEMHCMSAEHGRNTYELWDHVTKRIPNLPSPDFDREEPNELRIAVLGRPNIGKSTLVNRMIGEDRHIVHDMPGTTMDAIDSVIETPEGTVRFVDTAGVRRRARIGDPLETWATLRAIKAIERCHVTLLMVNGEEGPSKQDARLAALVTDRGRACIILVNRWDAVSKMEDRNSYVLKDELETELGHISWAPVLYISALTGKGCQRIMSTVRQAYSEFEKRITTSQLNKFLESAIEAHSVPQRHHHPVRLNYMTQVRVRPPTFVIFSNTPDGVKKPYRRYLENRLRSSYGFEGSPLRIQFRKKRKPGETR
jgi:GTP-binding protein